VPPRPDPDVRVAPAVRKPLAAPGTAASRARNAGHAPRGEFEPAYVTRKRLTAHELLAAAGVGLGAALAAFYVAKVWLERTPVLPPAPPPAPPDVAGDGPTGTVHRTVTPQRAAT